MSHRAAKRLRKQFQAENGRPANRAAWQPGSVKPNPANPGNRKYDLVTAGYVEMRDELRGKRKAGR